MTPKEKAEELTDRFRDTIVSFLSDNMKQENAKKCAFIAVDEIIAQIEPSVSMDVISARITYWQRVKQEIENL
jgi:hypothetical protein